MLSKKQRPHITHNPRTPKLITALLKYIYYFLYNKASYKFFDIRYLQTLISEPDNPLSFTRILIKLLNLPMKK